MEVRTLSLLIILSCFGQTHGWDDGWSMTEIIDCTVNVQAIPGLYEMTEDGAIGDCVDNCDADPDCAAINWQMTPEGEKCLFVKPGYYRQPFYKKTNSQYVEMCCLTKDCQEPSDPYLITPSGAEQHKSYDNDDVGYGAQLAIDGDLDTFSRTAKDSSQWFKITLDETHCVHNVRLDFVYDDPSSWQYDTTIWSCNKEGCDQCEGSYCEEAWARDSVEVNGAEGGLDECKNGNEVMFTFDSVNNDIMFTEVSVYGIKVCRAPTINGGTISPSGDIRLDSRYTVTCDEGFTLEGSDTITCTDEAGKATLSALPTCEGEADDGEIDCEDKANWDKCYNTAVQGQALCSFLAFFALLIAAF